MLATFPQDNLINYDVHEWKACVSDNFKHDFISECGHDHFLLRCYGNQAQENRGLARVAAIKLNFAKWDDSFLGKRGWEEKQFHTAVLLTKQKCGVAHITRLTCYNESRSA
jgi:hypothetical protein